jgi:tetraacyldisaccharide 4'-kinase
MTQTRTARPLLLPLVPVYRFGLALRELRLRSGWEATRRLGFPVISIGNLSTGGSGKTPFTIALVKLLAAKGIRVDVLSRGYGRRGTSPARVRPEGTADEFGDEPLLIARTAGVPVYVAPQRHDAGLMAEADWARDRQSSPAERIPGIHILDDGFQHRQLARDINIVLLNREDWHDGLLPAGNLREPLRALRRATCIAIPADQADLETELRAWGWTGLIWRLLRRMEIPPAQGQVAAFCGIARPAQFYSGLEAAGLQLVMRRNFRDHHRYTAEDIHRLVAGGRNAGAVEFLTTDKDQVRLANLAAKFPAELPLKTASLQIQIENPNEALEGLEERLATGSVTAAL